MSIDARIRRLQRAVEKTGHVNAEYERNMVMVSVGGKGLDDKFKTRPFHKKPGSMRNKRNIRNFLHNEGETTVELFTNVMPVSVGGFEFASEGPMLISGDGTVTVEMGFDYAVMKSSIEHGVQALHGEQEQDGTLWPPKQFRYSENMRISRGLNDPNPLHFGDMTFKPEGVQVPPVLKDGEPWRGEVKPGRLRGEISHPLEFVAIDPGTPGYPDRCVTARGHYDPSTGKLDITSYDLVAPPARGTPPQPDSIQIEDVEKAVQSDIADGQFQNIWEKEGDLHSEPTKDQKAEQILAEADNVLNNLLESINLVQVNTKGELPMVGDTKLTYYVADVNMFYRWAVDMYVPVQLLSPEMTQIVEKSFPTTATVVMQELQATDSQDNRSWARKLWDKLTGKN